MKMSNADSIHSCESVRYYVSFLLEILRGNEMITINATKARSKLYKLIDEAYESSEPIQITGKRGNAVLISEDNWKAIQETLYLLSIPGMRDSIHEGLNTPIDKCSEELNW
jgi:prevent-host-death family protein